MSSKDSPSHVLPGTGSASQLLRSPACALKQLSSDWGNSEAPLSGAGRAEWGPKRFSGGAADPWHQSFAGSDILVTSPSRPCRLQVPANGRRLPWLLGGGGHLRRDEGLNDTVVGWQQVTVAIGGFGALIQHQAAGGHCRDKGSCWLPTKPILTPPYPPLGVLRTEEARP